jgi:hypothetical protein
VYFQSRRGAYQIPFETPISHNTIVESTPLRAAIMMGSNECAKVLLPYYDVTMLTANGDECLAMLAVRYNRASIVQAMIEKGVKFPSIYFQDDTALQWALFKGSAETAWVLLQRFAREIDLTGHFGAKNRMLLQEIPNPLMAAILMVYGFDMSAPVQEGSVTFKNGISFLVERSVHPLPLEDILAIVTEWQPSLLQLNVFKVFQSQPDLSLKRLLDPTPIPLCSLSPKFKIENVEEKRAGLVNRIKQIEATVWNV